MEPLASIRQASSATSRPSSAVKGVDGNPVFAVDCSHACEQSTGIRVPLVE
jgi:hypothetical protein